MGILNITPDSFYGNSRCLQTEDAIARGIQYANTGADILDIGGESTRPGAAQVSEEEELNRVIPVIRALKEKTSCQLSIDTIKPNIAAAAVDAGASLINDVSGFRDPAMREVAAAKDVQICVMHMQGTPQTMQLNPHYPEGIIPHLLKWFDSQIELLIRSGIKENQIIIDPGIGFGKTIADNLEIIQNLPGLKSMGFPVLLGVSRKSFMQKILKKSPEELLSETLAINTIAIMAGVDVIRVHDVVEHRGIIDLLAMLKTVPSR